MNSGSEKSDDGGSTNGRSSTPPSAASSSGGGGGGGPPPSSGTPGTPGSGACPQCRQLLCSCVKSPADLLNYQRLASSVPSLVYHGGGGTAGANPSSIPNPPYSPDQMAYLAAAASAFYSMNGGGLPESMKDGGLGPTPAMYYPTMYHPYDPFVSAAAASYGFNGYPMDHNGRRKNATRETTSTLKAWLAEHKKNPYPTKGEKIMLAIITKMTLTQVSTWFANARRRLKKENKMTWEPRNRPDDDDDVDVSDSEPESTKKQSDDQENSERLGSTNSHVHGKSSPTGSSCSEGSSRNEGSSSTPNAKPRIWNPLDVEPTRNGSSGGGSGSHHHPLHPHHPLHHHFPPGGPRVNAHSHPSLPGSAFNMVSRSHHHSEAALYRGLYPSMAHHHNPSSFHSSDNP